MPDCVSVDLNGKFQPEGAPPPMPGKNVLSFDNIADLEASNIPGDVYAIVLLGYYIIGDAPAVTYTRWTNADMPKDVPPQPPLPPLPANYWLRSGRLKSLDGKWWEISPPGDCLDVRWFGAVMGADALGKLVDDREALQNAIDFASDSSLSGKREPIRAAKVRTVFIPEGTLRVGGTVFVRGVTLRGTGPMQSTITLTANLQVCIHMDGGSQIKPTAKSITGGGLQSLSISMIEGGIGWIGVYVAGDKFMQPDESVLEDLKISGGGTWYQAMWLNGMDRRLEPGEKGLKGLRKVTIRNLFLGNAIGAAFIADGVSDLSVYNAGSFASLPEGTTPNLNFVVRGDDVVPAGTGTTPTPRKPAIQSDKVQFVSCNIQEDIIIDRAESVTVTGTVRRMSCQTNAKGCALYGTLLTGTANSGFVTVPNMGNESYVATLR
jgi:hypothetical protein